MKQNFTFFLLSIFPLYTLPKPPSPNRESGLKFWVALQSSWNVKISAVMFPFPIFLISSVIYLRRLLSAQNKKVEEKISPLKCRAAVCFYSECAGLFKLNAEWVTSILEYIQCIQGWFLGINVFGGNCVYQSHDKHELKGASGLREIILIRFSEATCSIHEQTSYWDLDRSHFHKTKRLKLYVVGHLNVASMEGRRKKVRVQEVIRALPDLKEMFAKVDKTFASRYSWMLFFRDFLASFSCDRQQLKQLIFLISLYSSNAGRNHHQIREAKIFRPPALQSDGKSQRTR